MVIYWSIITYLWLNFMVVNHKMIELEVMVAMRKL